MTFWARLLLLYVLAWTGHEAGHALVTHLHGMQTRLTGRWLPIPGAGIRCGSPHVIKPAVVWFEIALAGPAASLLAAALFVHTSPLFALCSIDIGLVSLIPFKPQDGWRALQAGRELTPKARRRSAELQARVLSYSQPVSRA